MPANAQNLIESFAEVVGLTSYAYSSQDTGAFLFEIPGGSVGTTLLLPDDPNDADWYELADVDGSCSSTHPIIVAAGEGATILGGGSFTFTAAYASGKVRYVARLHAWVFISGPSGGGGGVTAVDAGVGISVDTVAGVATVSNDGVLDVDAGTGIGVSTVAGVATVTNEGVLDVEAGTGISVSTVAGVATVTNTSPGGGGIVAVAAGAGISVSTIAGTATVTNTEPFIFAANEAANNADVDIATTATLIAQFSQALDSATALFIQACVTFENTSEGGGVGSDIVLSILIDGLSPSVRAVEQDTLAVGANFCCTAVQYNVSSLSAGTHTFAISATSTGDVGNCKVPANQGNIHALFFG